MVLRGFEFSARLENKILQFKVLSAVRVAFTGSQGYVWRRAWPCLGRGKGWGAQRC